MNETSVSRKTVAIIAFLNSKYWTEDEQKLIDEYLYGIQLPYYYIENNYDSKSAWHLNG